MNVVANIFHNLCCRYGAFYTNKGFKDTSEKMFEVKFHFEEEYRTLNREYVSIADKAMDIVREQELKGKYISFFEDELDIFNTISARIKSNSLIYDEILSGEGTFDEETVCRFLGKTDYILSQLGISIFPKATRHSFFNNIIIQNILLHDALLSISYMSSSDLLSFLICCYGNELFIKEHTNNFKINYFNAKKTFFSGYISQKYKISDAVISKIEDTCLKIIENRNLLNKILPIYKISCEYGILVPYLGEYTHLKKFSEENINKIVKRTKLTGFSRYDLDYVHVLSPNNIYNAFDSLNNAHLFCSQTRANEKNPGSYVDSLSMYGFFVEVGNVDFDISKTLKMIELTLQDLLLEYYEVTESISLKNIQSTFSSKSQKELYAVFMAMYIWSSVKVHKHSQIDILKNICKNKLLEKCFQSDASPNKSCKYFKSCKANISRQLKEMENAISAMQKEVSEAEKVIYLDNISI